MTLFRIIDLGNGNQFYCYPVGKDYYFENDFLIEDLKNERKKCNKL